MCNFGDIIEIIDNSIADEKNVIFVCNYDLAESISAYLSCEYSIEDEDNCLDEDINEYYVSLNFDCDDTSFIVESAKGHSGKFKVNDIDNYDYYIQNSIIKQSEAWDYLQGNYCIHVWFNYNDDLECCDCDTCEDYNNIDCLIDEYIEKIQEIGLCPNCLRDCLQDFANELMN